MNSLIACVTGASGIIGSKICKRLISAGYKVRVLSRQKHFNISGAESFIGDILKEADLKVFMQNADIVFHCAAELKDESKMWAVNVIGTERIMKYAELCGIKYFCYLSSVGVIGKTDLKLVDESTPCDPRNAYEKSKWAAEKLVLRGIRDCKVLVLRPTDVIDERNLGVLALPKRSSFMDFCKVFIKGGECAHIVHAEDVAHAAIHFIDYPLETPQCYVVSCDDEPLNTFAGAFALYDAFCEKKTADNLRFIPHLPFMVPYFLRKLLRGGGNAGDVRYSSKKLMDTGFKFKFGLKEGIRQIALAPDSTEKPPDKPVILTFIGYYLPGNKAGGILRITINTIDHLCDEFDFRIVTRDRDLGEGKAYTDIKADQWQKVGNATVYYLSPRSTTLKAISSVIMRTPHHALYLNSFFDPLTVMVLLSRRFRGTVFRPVIVVPWGEFGWASLKQKYFKKFVFIQIARLVGLYKNVTWRASSELEKSEIIKIMHVRSDAIEVIGDLPIKNMPQNSSAQVFTPPTERKGLRIVFLSRISREKNLDYALRVLRKVKASVLFDIYGPAENESYWKECQKLIAQLPSNVVVNYHGSVKSDHVLSVFSRYDLFLFPTGGEAYGHVIAECLTAGTPVLISTETPWRDLQEDQLGWDIDLKHMDSFVEIIEKLALSSDNERLKNRLIIKNRIGQRLLDPVVMETNRRLFKERMQGENRKF